GTNEAVFTDDGTVLYNRTHADENMICNGTGMQDNIVSDGYAAADVNIISMFYMNGCIFMYIGIIPGGNGLMFRMNDCAGADNHIFTQCYIANNGGGGEYITRVWDGRGILLEFANHDKTSFRKRSYSYHNRKKWLDKGKIRAYNH